MESRTLECRLPAALLRKRRPPKGGTPTKPTHFQENDRDGRVQISRHLTRHFAIPAECEAFGSTARDLLVNLNERYPGVTDYILHETGEIRQHVNIFVGERIMSDRRELSDSLDGVDEVSIMQALSGG
ncbi:MAG: hypothetical protein CMJ64_22095 [Planctomycetaceae bacterium]|nr:hypothetical protein [Planctomycetaceae bacterium]